MNEFETLLAEAEADPRVLGVVLGGSRGKGDFVTERSDFDVYMIVEDGSTLPPLERGGEVELITVTLAEFREHALVDKLGGEIAELTAAKANVDPAGAAGPLDAYVNSYYRSAKNARDGRPFEARLDAAESVNHFLDFLFAAFGRLRPYNKWLRWELDRYPLEPPWTAVGLLPRLERILDGELDEQPALFRDAERLARQRGLGEIVDGWEPDVSWLRGDPSERGTPE